MTKRGGGMVQGWRGMVGAVDGIDGNSEEGGRGFRWGWGGIAG